MNKIKTTLTAILLMAVTLTTVSAQEILLAKNLTADHQTPVSPLLKKEYVPGLKMRNIGRTLTICGGVSFITGIILMSGADEYYYNTSTSTNGGSSESGDPQGAIGLLLTIAGTGMTVTGIILWSKGQKKYNFYKDEKGTVSLRPGARGLTLAYTF